MSEPIDLALGILDHQLLDSEGFRCGKVDDLELGGIQEGKPVVETIIVGRRNRRRVHVPWDEVEKVDSAVWLKRPARVLRLRRGDDRLRPLLEWIPGAQAR
jgi:sporulation protein YlmC with PRC-barrel domain